MILILSSVKYSSEIDNSEFDVIIFENYESLIVRILNPARLKNPPCYVSLSGLEARDLNNGLEG